MPLNGFLNATSVSECRLDFRFEKQVQLSGERTLRAARALGRGLDAA
jgi:hypothetical protein